MESGRETIDTGHDSGWYNVIVITGNNVEIKDYYYY